MINDGGYTETVVPSRSVKKGVLRNFANFTEKQLCQRLFFNKFAGLPKNISKNTFSYRATPVAAPGYTNMINDDGNLRSYLLLLQVARIFQFIIIQFSFQV